MDSQEIDAVRAMLGARPRPVGWVERRARIEEVGAASPVAGDIRLACFEARADARAPQPPHRHPRA